MEISQICNSNTEKAQKKSHGCCSKGSCHTKIEKPEKKNHDHLNETGHTHSENPIQKSCCAKDTGRCTKTEKLEKRNHNHSHDHLNETGHTHSENPIQKTCGSKKTGCCSSKSIEKSIVIDNNQILEFNINYTTIDFKITGMDCAGCATILDAHVLQLGGIKKIITSATAGKSSITFDKSILIPDRIIAHINELTFKAFLPSTGIQFFFKFPRLSSDEREVSDTMIKNYLTTLPGITRFNVLSKCEDNGSICEVSYDQDMTGSRDILESLKLHFDNQLISVLPMNIKNKMETSDSDLWLNRFIVSLILFVPTIISAFVLMQIGDIKKIYMLPIFRGLPLRFFVEWALATPLQCYFAWPIYKSTWNALYYTYRANIDTLICISTSIAYFYSLGVVITIVSVGNMDDPVLHDVFFETSVILLTLIFLGRYLEIYSQKKATDAVSKLFQRQSDKVTLISKKNNEEMEILSDLIQRRDNIKILPGEKLIADGTIISGSSYIDESMLTGESNLRKKNIGDSVFAGTINSNGLMVMEVTKIPGETILDDIATQLEKSQLRKSPTERITDTIAGHFAITIIIIASIVFTIWMVLSYKEIIDISPSTPVPYSLKFALAVLVVACPCALALAAPMALLIGSNVAAKNNILFKGGDILEVCAKIEIVCFDKTGTLTEGKISISEINCEIEDNMENFLHLLGSLELGSEHSIGKAIVLYVQSNYPNIHLTPPDDVEIFPGFGITGLIEQTRISVGNAEFFKREQFNVKLPNDVKFTKEIEKLRNEGKTVVYVVVNNKYFGYVVMVDSLRIGAELTIKNLIQQGKEVWMISGDHITTCKTIANRLGISSENVIGGVSPLQKAEKVEELQNKGTKKLMMVGDGINDSVALGLADVGCLFFGSFKLRNKN